IRRTPRVDAREQPHERLSLIARDAIIHKVLTVDPLDKDRGAVAPLSREPMRVTRFELLLDRRERRYPPFDPHGPDSRESVPAASPAAFLERSTDTRSRSRAPGL